MINFNFNTSDEYNYDVNYDETTNTITKLLYNDDEVYVDVFEKEFNEEFSKIMNECVRRTNS